MASSCSTVHSRILGLTHAPTLQLVRIRSRDGNFRFTLDPADDISALVQQASPCPTLTLFLHLLETARDCRALARDAAVEQP